jgi:succinyl-diaminopimelate desuccinylase
MNDLTTTLTNLVATPSVVGSEGRLCTLVAERLMPTWGREGVERIGNSVVVGRRSGKPLLTLYGHIDTVPAQGDNQVRVEDGRLYGLGSSDMKAGVAVMVHILENIGVRSGPYDVIGVFYDREEGPSAENGLIEVLARATWLSDAEFGIVMEPTDLEIQVGCQCVVNATSVFEGAAAHSARPWLGANAITKAGEWLSRLDAMEPSPVIVGGHEFREVVTVTKASGGIANNIVPARFEANVNYRFPPTLSVAEAEARLRELVAGADTLEVTDRASGAPVPEDNPHLDRLVAASGAVQTPKQAWTDVARLTERGVPAVNYGPGEVAQAHQPGESVPLHNLELAFTALHQFLTT